MDITIEINNAFTATQLLIVFVLFLFTLFYSKIQEKIELEEDGTIAKQILSEEIRNTLWNKSFILFISTLLIILLFFPVLIQICFNWSYSYQVYSFLVIFTFVFGFFGWSIKLMRQLIIKIKDLRKTSNFNTFKFIIGIK